MQRLSGISVDCLVLTDTELTDLIWENKENFKKDFDSWDIKDKEDIEFDVLDDIVYGVPFMSALYDFTGSFWKRHKEVLTGYDNDTLYIIELQKNVLYDKYEDDEEIIQELKNGLADMGIVVDDEFIKEHFGFLEGTY